MIFSAGNILMPNCDFNYYFLDAFSIKYYMDESLNKNGMFIVIDDLKAYILKNYYGLRLTKEIVKNRTLVEKKIENAVLYKLKPVGVQMDSFYIPWNKLQYQMHRTHCFLITEILNDHYICIDTFLSENKVCITKKTLIDNIDCLLFFDYDEKLKKDTNLNSLILLIKNYIRVERKKHIEKIEAFADNILSCGFETIQNADYDNIEQSSLIFCIAALEWSRNNFSKALTLAKKSFNTSLFDNIILIVDDIYVMWGTVKSLMMKNMIFNNYYKKAGQLLQKIADKENEVMELLLNLTC